MSIKHHPIAEADRIPRTAPWPESIEEFSLVPDFDIRRTRIPLPAAKLSQGALAAHDITQAEWMYAHVLHWPKARAERVFILQNGLNEIFGWDLYHAIAADLLAHCREKAICILLPAPFHLDRYPHTPDPHPPHAPTLTPLESFFAEPLRLWSMYCRQMLELELLISLLPGGAQHSAVRYREDLLTPELLKELFAVCNMPLSTINAAKQKLAAFVCPTARVHMIGFSLGGLASLAALFLYPELIDGSVAICAGGGLHQLSPHPLCEPEEWQRLLEVLRYKMATSQPVAPVTRTAEGAQRNARLRRVFEEVYLRSSDSGFRRRIDEFNRRTMFILGGDDPIMPLASMASRSEPLGASFVSLARVRHFVHRDQAWGTYSNLTASVLREAAGLATSSCLPILPAGRAFAGIPVEPQRIQDDLAYAVKTLRAIAGDACEVSAENFSLLSSASAPDPIRLLGEGVRPRLQELSASLPDLDETSLDEIFDSSRGIGLRGETKLTELRLQLYLLGHVERPSTAVCAAVLDYPSVLACPEYLGYRAGQIFADPSERARYVWAVQCRQAMLAARLESEDDAELLVLFSHDFVGRQRALREANGPGTAAYRVSSRGNNMLIPNEVYNQQRTYLASRMRKWTSLQVRTLEFSPRELLAHPFYLGLPLSNWPVRNRKSRGVVLSRAFYDRDYSARMMTDDKSELDNYRWLFARLWIRGTPVSADQVESAW